jgi:glutamine cyclotransferase
VVDANGDKINRLNELEIIDEHRRYVFANQFLYNDIHMIDLDTGKCVKSWNLKEL